MSDKKQGYYRLRNCGRCGGDAYLDVSDEPEWRCMQCARPVPSRKNTAPAVFSIQSASR